MAEPKVVVYTGADTDASERLQNLITSVIPETSIEISRSIETLSSRLSHCVTSTTITVLLAGSTRELHELLGIYDLLVNFRIVFIIPDGEAETIALCHRLYPRFMSSATSDFNGVGAVLKRLFYTIG